VSARAADECFCQDGPAPATHALRAWTLRDQGERRRASFVARQQMREYIKTAPWGDLRRVDRGVGSLVRSGDAGMRGGGDVTRVCKVQVQMQVLRCTIRLQRWQSLGSSRKQEEKMIFCCNSHFLHVYCTSSLQDINLGRPYRRSD